MDRQDVCLPGQQEEFVRRLSATGQPVILVVFGGRPMAFGSIEPDCAAIFYAWYPGQAGGIALADILHCAVNPSGHLTITLPRTAAQVPISYRLG